jgi:MFS transporter, DHA1 family, inner membrane transport protein
MSPESGEAAGACPRRSGGGWPLLLVLAAVQFTNVLDFVILMPLGVRYQRELSVGQFEFGLLVAAYAFSACLSGLAASSWLDRFDRKHALLFLYAGFTLATLGCGAAPGFWALLAARAAAGACGGVLGAVMLAIIGDAFPEERRGLATGVVMSSFSAATIAGVPAGLFLAEACGAAAAPFLALAGLCAVLWVLAALLMPPLRVHLHGGPRRLTPPWETLFEPAHLPAYGLMTVLVLSTFLFIPSLPSFLVFNLGFAEDRLYLMYLCGGATTLVTTPLIGRLADRFGKLRTFRVLAVLTAGVIALLTNLAPVPALVVLLVTTLFTVTTSGRMVPAMALITSSARPASRGRFLSVTGSVQQMAMGLASVLGGWLLSQPGKRAPLEGMPLVGMLGCVACVATVFLAALVRPAAPAVVLPPGAEVPAETVPAVGSITAAADAALLGEPGV